MASDLSNIIQDVLCSTLQGLLAKDTSLKMVNKSHIKDIQEHELLKVESEFIFEKITTKFSFLIPANSASIIFNTMMGAADHDIVTKIDDDISDAMGEFVSTLSGGLVTSLNGESFEDLGKVKFNIAHKEIVQGSEFSSVENIFLFSLDLESTLIPIFIQFDQEFTQFIQEISNAAVTEHPEEIEEKVEEEEEIIEEIPKESEPEITNAKEEKENEEEKEELPTQEDGKNKKLKLLVMIVGGLVGVVILTAIIMFFMGAFEAEPVVEKKPEANVTIQSDSKVSVVKYNTLKKVNFHIEDINKRRLNARLEALTKYEVLNQEEIEAQELEEKNRLFELNKEKELIAFSLKNKEEPVFEKVPLAATVEVDKKTKFKNETYAIKKENIIITNNIQTAPAPQIQESTQTEIESELQYILTNKLNYKLFKELIIQTGTKIARVSICTDENQQTTIFIGPFESETLQTKMETLLKEQNTDIVVTSANITLEEFDTRCNF